MQHPFHKKFSFPIHFQEIFKDRVNFFYFLKEHQNLINEIYFVPFMFELNYDAHNGKPLFFSKAEIKEIFSFFKLIRSKTDIKFCLVYNDIFLTEAEEYLKINELKHYLSNDPELPIDIIVANSLKWLELKKDFPNLIIKNTVVNLPTFDEIKNGKYDLYDMIYVHDEIVHNLKKYRQLKEITQKNFGVIVNFDWCRSDCPFKYQHYHDFKFLKEQSQPNIDSYCPSIILNDPDENYLKDNRIPMFYNSYKKFLDTVTIFKLQGRRDKNAFHNSMEIIKNIKLKKDILDNTFYLPSFFENKKLRKEWEDKVINCGGECSSCSYCNNLLLKYKK